MQKSIFLMPDIHKRSIKAGYQFLYPAEVDVANLKMLVFFLTIKFNQLLFFEQCDFNLACGWTNDKFFVQLNKIFKHNNLFGFRENPDHNERTFNADESSYRYIMQLQKIRLNFKVDTL